MPDNKLEPFRTETFRVAGLEIRIESYRDGEVDAYRQRNGSGGWNAKKYTLWRVYVNGRFDNDMTSRFGYSGWEAYERARQRHARTGDARGVPSYPKGPIVRWTRMASVVKTEMQTARVK